MPLPKLILREHLYRLGWPGLAGVVLLLAGAVYGLGWIMPASQHRDQVRERAVRAAAQLNRPPDQGAVQQNTEPSERTIYQRLTAEDAVSTSIERIYAAAAAEQIALDRGEYAHTAVANTRLARYQIVLPVKADYGRIRRFMATALTDVPGLTLDDLSLQRKNIGEAEVEARVQFSLYLVRP